MCPPPPPLGTLRTLPELLACTRALLRHHQHLPPYPPSICTRTSYLLLAYYHFTRLHKGKNPLILHQNFLPTPCTLTLTSYLAEMHHNFHLTHTNLLLLTRLHQPPFPPFTLHQNIWWCTRVSVPKCDTCPHCTHTFPSPFV